MGMCASGICGSGYGTDFKDEFTLEFGSAYVKDNLFSIENGNAFSKVSQEFLTNLPSAKVLLVSSKSKRGHKEKDGIEVRQEASGLLYDLADDFTVPKELCFNQEEGLLLVLNLSNEI